MCVTFVVHGSRQEQANQFMIKMIGRIDSKPKSNIGFLEFAEPTLADALLMHVKVGCKLVRVVPVFLMPGRHVSKDIPDIVADIKQKYPEVDFQLESFIGERVEFETLLKKLL